MPEKKSLQQVNATQDAPLDQSLLLGLVGYNCKRAYLHIKPMFDKRMAKYDLRPVDFTVLSLLKANPNLSQKRLSAAIHVSPPNLAILLDRLASRGLLARQRNPQDKRSQMLVLTTEGKRLCGKAEKTVGELEASASSALTAAERAELIRLLQKIG
ncbi:MarR family winged helix-turn-helix transcriptional regulator [Duganella sp. CT11-25]|uniref:MarR family winged helix-turn-helix transcriptional regulator n=1 Tax=unclassified Duganella TaxID=2636909 RepID=UPI0039B0D8B5